MISIDYFTASASTGYAFDRIDYSSTATSTTDDTTKNTYYIVPDAIYIEYEAPKERVVYTDKWLRILSNQIYEKKNRIITKKNYLKLSTGYQKINLNRKNGPSRSGWVFRRKK